MLLAETSVKDSRLLCIAEGKPNTVTLLHTLYFAGLCVLSKLAAVSQSQLLLDQSPSKAANSSLCPGKTYQVTLSVT